MAGSICIYNDTARTVSEIEKISSADAKSYPEFERSFARIGKSAGAVDDDDAALN